MHPVGVCAPETYCIRHGAQRRFTRRCYAASRVDELAQSLADLEEGNPLLGNVDAAAGLRITPLAGGAVPDTEATEAPQLDLVAFGEGIGDVVEDRVDNGFRFFLRQIRDFRDFVDQLGLGHARHRLTSREPPRRPPDRSTVIRRMSTSVSS